MQLWKRFLFTNSADVFISSSDYKMPYLQPAVLFRARFVTHTVCS